ncbi:serine/threonine-protein kinase Nek3 isoform X2 [Rhinatrema bivittatum]|uniref:serine/threonine-protein kinase Nek3 isoform X2 n=1 Tax=Rhinatrema bivittatum TaxID=194408 RepID=UPI0011285B07|nr:serine/threonine-protein kinase Nek3 isoform X2 [Rhinatrema bivittatum]
MPEMLDWEPVKLLSQWKHGAVYGAEGDWRRNLWKSSSSSPEVQWSPLRHEGNKTPQGAVQDSRREAVLLAKMKHPSIVAFRESFEADGHLYIVMEYCDGGDLLQTIKRQKGKLFPEEKILHWFVQMCLGVKHIHDQLVLHRDIKSKNIFLTQNGKVKLGDFGSARLLRNSMAFACTYIGTPYYVPPEIWENLPYNNKSDIWSLGCVLYELCTLKHPFQANGWKNLILKICQGSYSPLPAQYSYELHYLIKQMFRRSPKQRPSASTILTRGRIARLIRRCVQAETTAEREQHLEKESRPEDRVQEKTDRAASAKDRTAAGRRKQQWDRGPPSAVLNVLQNASLLSSSTAEEEDSEERQAGGGITKCHENNARKQWVREPPEALLNMLENADVSLAFRTYTVYKPGCGDCLRGPLSTETKASDATDGSGEDTAADPERFEPRSDDYDTDFEEEDVDPSDWVSELKRMVEM